MTTEQQAAINAERIYPALVVNDYAEAPYAEWIKTGVKTIETRMNRLFAYRGDIVICCGSSNSVGKNKGKAICIVEIWKGRDMLNNEAEIKAACIGWDSKRKSLLLRNWRYFNDDFVFAPHAIKKNFQGIFSIHIPKHIEIIPMPEMLQYPEPIDLLIF